MTKPDPKTRERVATAVDAMDDYLAERAVDLFGPRSTVGTMTDIASYLNLLFRHDRRSALPAHG